MLLRLMMNIDQIYLYLQLQAYLQSIVAAIAVMIGLRFVNIATQHAIKTAKEVQSIGNDGNQLSDLRS